jgi:hypothetical protein
MLRVHVISKQKRIVAKMQYKTHTRIISLPVSYDISLCVVRKGGKRELIQVIKYFNFKCGLLNHIKQQKHKTS